MIPPLFMVWRNAVSHSPWGPIIDLTVLALILFLFAAAAYMALRGPRN